MDLTLASHIAAVVGGLGVVGCGIWIQLLRGRVTVAEMKRVEAVELAAEYRVEHSELLEAMKSQQVLVEEVIAEAKASDERAARYFTHIETIERERNEVWELYNDARSGHANAQSMMLAEMDRLAKLAKKPLDPKFKAVAEEFVARHDLEAGLPSKVTKAGARPPPPAPPAP